MNPPKKAFSIHPRSIIAITVAVMLVTVLSAWVEWRQSRDELYHMMESEAISLIETVARSGENILRASEEIELLLAQRLHDNAYFVALLDSQRVVTQKDLERIARTNELFRINILDAEGRRLVSSHTAVHRESESDRLDRMKALEPVLSGEAREMVIGLREARMDSGRRFAFAVRRMRPGGGAVVVNLDAADLLEFRRSIGIGRLLRDLGDNHGIEYVAVQDRGGILAASEGVKEMGAIETDTFLQTALDADTLMVRTLMFEGREVFEVVAPLGESGDEPALIRVGRSMEEIKAVEVRMLRRLVVISIVLIALGSLMVIAIIANQNYRLANREYQSIKTFTGNVLEQMRDAVVTIDELGRFTIFNRQAEELFGGVARDVLGRTVQQLPGGLPDCLEALFALPVGTSERSIPCREERSIVASVTVSQTVMPDGRRESMTLVIKDLTEAKRLEEEMRRKERLSAMGELASGVAHEIRNPMNAISMIAQRLETEFEPAQGAEEYKGLAKIMRSEIARINRIIRQFLQFARPAQPNFQDVNLSALLERAAAVVDAQARAKRVRLTTECNPDLISFVDQEQMMQALLNLLQNALDATPSGGQVRLAAARKGSGYTIDVTDTGSGIGPDALEKIFNPYYTTKNEGTGMGLAITQQIISRHGGSISVSSEPGKGSRFTIVLPR
jgi:PAS domain S-box-containing protein